MGPSSKWKGPGRSEHANFAAGPDPQQRGETVITEHHSADTKEREFPPRHLYAAVEKKPVSDRLWTDRAAFIEKRRHTRRAADRNFMFALVTGAVMLSLTMFALGYYWAANDAAALVLGAK
jgi:hypothetical protein